jgi:aspartate ammonia-lyase
VPRIGYANATRIAAEALASGATVGELVAIEGLLTLEELGRLLSPQAMLRPGGELA